MRLLLLTPVLLVGCLAGGSDDGHVADVRLELVNDSLTPVSAWLLAEDANGSIWMQTQVLVQPDDREGAQQAIVIDDLQQFRAKLSRTGDDMKTLARGMDGDCYEAESIVFRVVAGPGPGPEYNMELHCT